MTLSVDGKVWSEPLSTAGLLGNKSRLAGRGDQYLAWPNEYPPSRIHSSVDGLTWTTSDIAVDERPYSPGKIYQVRWNGAQYVLLGTSFFDVSSTLIARSCNGRVWDAHIVCSGGVDYVCNVTRYP